jgi:hypothetical protein
LSTSCISAKSICDNSLRVVRTRWTAGPNWALRISDLLAVTVADVRGAQGIKRSFRVRQMKTGKTVTCDITPKVKKAIVDYLGEGHPGSGQADVIRR